MKLGVFTPVFGHLSTSEMLAKVRALGSIEAVELGTGAWPGSAHLNLDALLDDHQKASDYAKAIADAGLFISALSCHGNPIHPSKPVASVDDVLFRKTVRLASLLDVPVVVTFSGCPGDSDQALHPNWVTTAWPPECLQVLDWQWQCKTIPYWRDAERFAADHGVKVAIEAHPGFMVYNVETALRLRTETGSNLGVNFDPSHLFWQGVDPAVAIRALGPAIFHVHAKDVALDPSNVAVNGVIDAKSYHLLSDRSWIFRSVGWGHDELTWKRLASALRSVGYDYVISIEHEDAMVSVDEGIASAVDLLSRVILKEPPVKPWWTEKGQS